MTRRSGRALRVGAWLYPAAITCGLRLPAPGLPS